MPTVHTYYQPVPGRPRPDKLLKLWADSWGKAGFETKILSEADAKTHPGYAYYSDNISRFPTVNPPAYERACYMRWLAMANIGGDGFMVDYDVVLNPAADYWCWSESPFFSLECFEPTRVPCAMRGDNDGYENLCDMICEYKPTIGERHVSDMTIVRQSKIHVSSECPLCVEHLDSGRPIVDDPGDGWKMAPMIHFSSFSFSKLGWTGDKADMIQRVLASL